MTQTNFHYRDKKQTIYLKFVCLQLNVLGDVCGRGGGRIVFAGGREMKIFSTVFRGFWEKYGRETVFSTLDGAGNYWKKITRNRDW